MRTLHHIGIPTEWQHENETYLADAKLYITDATTSPNKIEWLRFEADSPMPKMLKATPHIAYQVDDLESEMVGKEVLMEPFSPMEGVTVAFVIEEGRPDRINADERVAGGNRSGLPAKAQRRQGNIYCPHLLSLVFLGDLAS